MWGSGEWFMRLTRGTRHGCRSLLSGTGDGGVAVRVVGEESF